MRRTRRIAALLLALALALPLSVPALATTEELSAKYNYNFIGDPLQLQKHDDGRGYASKEIEELAEWFGDDTDNYINALSRAGIIGFLVEGGKKSRIIAGSGYPHGREVEEIIDVRPAVDEFGDVPKGAWYYDAVMAVAWGGLVYGNENGLFCPEENLTAGQLAAVLCRVYNLPLHLFNKPWYGPYVDALQVAALDFSSCNRDFAEQEVTRGEAIETMLAMVKAQNREQTRSLTWADVQDANVCRSAPKSEHTWASAALLDALNWGVIDGVNAAHRVDPDRPLTRAELCQMLYNIGVTKARSVDSYRAHEEYAPYRAAR
ncbi:MAG: S-layer homology domain-containing protein [Ruminococcaceae bacterium]|nr:S-layer homology domain-containing protein [Oscillospiraceae bacterium]